MEDLSSGWLQPALMFGTISGSVSCKLIEKDYHNRQDYNV